MRCSATRGLRLLRNLDRASDEGRGLRARRASELLCAIRLRLGPGAAL